MPKVLQCLRLEAFIRRAHVRTIAEYGKTSCRLYRTGKQAMSTSAPLQTAEAAGKIEVNGVQLYYERRGTGPHALMCMPGALGSVQTDFPPQLEYFGRPESGFTVVGFDPRGYGKSRPHKRKFSTYPLFYETDANDAVGVMQSLGFEKFSLLGWSDGGVSAIISAARYPQLVKNLVVWGANAYVSKTDVELVEKTRDVTQWSPRMRVPMETMYGGDFPGLWSNWMDGFVGMYSDPFRKGDLCTHKTSQVQCPTLIVHGVKDALCPTFHAEYLAEKIAHSRYVTYPEGKHNVHLRYHTEFNKLVSDFLQENKL